MRCWRARYRRQDKEEEERTAFASAPNAAAYVPADVTSSTARRPSDRPAPAAHALAIALNTAARSSMLALAGTAKGGAGAMGVRATTRSEAHSAGAQRSWEERHVDQVIQSDSARIMVGQLQAGHSRNGAAALGGQGTVWYDITRHDQLSYGKHENTRPPPTRASPRWVDHKNKSMSLAAALEQAPRDTVHARHVCATLRHGSDALAWTAGRGQGRSAPRASYRTSTLGLVWPLAKRT